jgi:small subunit ribosomal protein S5
MARDFVYEEKPRSEFEERVVSVDRVSYTVAGGRRLRFRALVVVGNRQGRVGMGVAKAGEVAAAIQKAVTAAKKSLITAPIIRDTIPHSITTSYGGARVLLKPAPAGTSVIAGGSVRAVIELAGIKNISSKVLGSGSKINTVAATIEALGRLRIKSSEVPAETAPIQAEAPLAQPEAEAASIEAKTETVKPVKAGASRAKATKLKKTKA